MKKITNRAVSVLLIAAMIVCGMVLYVLNYVDHGRDWALFFSRANSDSTGTVTDRTGVMLAEFTATESRYAEDAMTRTACYHVIGDYAGNVGTGVLSNFWDDLQVFDIIYGATQGDQQVTLSLNIDSRLHQTAYQALNGRNGAVLLCNYKTGELLCLTSSPAIDPLDPNASIPDGAYINRCISAAYVPGSVFKLITSAAAIETLSGLDDMLFYCEGEHDIAGVTITCSGEHYTQTFEQALANSCNVAFAKIAVMLGQNTLMQYVRQYGFLDSHSLDGISTASGSYPQEFVGDPELAWSGIGQSTDLVCPYSLLRFVSGIANGGILCEPQLVSGREVEKSVMLSSATAEKLREMMAYNVSYHYGADSFPGLPVCAKTGTAELGDGTSHSWLAGFLDDEAHPYAFVVLIERGGGGLTNAGAVANTLLQEAVTLY